MNASFPDLRGEQRTKPVPPEPNRLVANADAPLEQKILDLSQVSVRSGRGMGPVKRISHVEARPHKVLSFCW